MLSKMIRWTIVTVAIAAIAGGVAFALVSRTHNQAWNVSVEGQRAVEKVGESPVSVTGLALGATATGGIDLKNNDTASASLVFSIQALNADGKGLRDGATLVIYEKANQAAFDLPGCIAGGSAVYTGHLGTDTLTAIAAPDTLPAGASLTYCYKFTMPSDAAFQGAAATGAFQIVAN